MIFIETNSFVQTLKNAIKMHYFSMSSFIYSFYKRMSFKSFFSSRPILEAALISFFIICAVFPDVIFNGASLRITDQINSSESRSIYSVPVTTGWWGGYNDNGGASFQAEPMMEFMRHSIESGQSPYWNPYSAAGSLGPESLVDQKFSLFTILYATLGGGTEIYNTILILLYFLSVFFMYRVARNIFKLTLLASVMLTLFYLLNGYSVANFGSNVTQSYLYIPMCLYASLIFIKKSTSFRFVFIVISFAILLSCTFIPTTVTSFIAIYAILIGYIFIQIQSNRINYRSGLMIFCIQIFAVICSILLLSFLYLPIFENISSAGTIEDYAKRTFYPLYFPYAIASFFSTSHLYESYNAMETGVLFWLQTRSLPGNTVFHMGIISIALAGSACSIRNSKNNILAFCCLLSIFFVLLRLFDVEIISQIMAKIPFVGSIGAHYWWPAIMIPMAFLVGLGTDNLQQHNGRIFPALLFISFGAASIFSVYKIYGFSEPNIDFKLGSLITLSVLSTVTVFLLLTVRFTKNDILTKGIILFFVFSLFSELIINGKMIRLARNDAISTPTESISFVRNNINLHRTLNFGQTGLRPELGSVFQIQESTTMNGGVLPSYQDYFYSAIKLDIPQRFSYHFTRPNGTFPTLLLIKDTPLLNQFDWNALSLLGIKYLILPSTFHEYKASFLKDGFKLVSETSDSFVFENIHVLPRSFGVEINDDNLISEYTLPLNFSTEIYPAEISIYENTNIEIKGYAARKMLIVLTDNWHENWTSTLGNNEVVKTLKVNNTFRGVIVPKGDFVIRMKYQPKTLPFSVVVSVLMILILSLSILFRTNLDNIFCRRFKFWSI